MLSGRKMAHRNLHRRGRRTRADVGCAAEAPRRRHVMYDRAMRTDPFAVSLRGLVLAAAIALVAPACSSRPVAGDGGDAGAGGAAAGGGGRGGASGGAGNAGANGGAGSGGASGEAGSGGSGRGGNGTAGTTGAAG